MTAVTDRNGATDAEFQARIAAFEGAPAAPESFDAIAALRRVEALADRYERQGGYLRIEPIAADLRAALAAVDGGDGA